MKSAVLLLNFGGPTSLEEVEPFLQSLLADRDAIRMPLPGWMQSFLAARIAARRAPRTRAQYAAIGGGSPLLAVTREQARALRERLAVRGADLDVVVGMRYTEPSIGAAVRGLVARDVERLIVLPLYPQYSIATTGSAFNCVVRELKAAGRRPPRLHFIPAFHREPAFIGAHAEQIATALHAAPPGAHLLFSAHGLPVSYIRRAGDPYLRQTQESVAAIVRQLASAHGLLPVHHLAWQSRVGPARWLRPSMEETIRRLADTGCRALVVAPLSFVSDHIETLYEIDILCAELAQRAGIDVFQRCPGVGGHPALVQALEEALLPLLRPADEEQWAQSCERCLLPPGPACAGAGVCRNCGHRLPAWRRYLQA
jgi:ferrochelatase